MTSLPPFAPIGSSLGRVKFWRGKLHRNPEIQLGLETRQEGISNKLSWAQFGFQEVPQNQLQTGTTHRESGAAHRGKIASLTKYCSAFRPALASLTFSLS